MKNLNNRPIGVFDSGLGGLTVVKELMANLPNESIVYLGDTARVPYGTRSNGTIIKYALQDVNFLISQNVKLIVVACATVSSVAIEALKQKYSGIPIIGVVLPASKQAVNATRNKRIGIIGTSSTIKSGSFEKHILSIDNSIKTVSAACPLFVPLVENGCVSGIAAHHIAKQYLTPIKQKDIDTIILGCTHFPLLVDVISDIMGSETRLINCAVPVVKEVENILKQDNMFSNGKPKHKFYVSDAPDNFTGFANLFLNKKIPDADVLQIDIEQY